MVLWATFTAKYLPLLVNRILDLPPHGTRSAEHYGLQNIYHTTLKFTDIAYLAKFMVSNRPAADGTSYQILLAAIASRTLCFEQGAKRLNMVMAERLVEYGPIWLNRDTTPTNDYDKHEGCIHKAVTTLMMLVVATKGQGIPETTKTELLKWLDTWIAYDSWSYMEPNDNMRVTCIVLGNMLKYSGDRLKSIVKQRRRALKCIEFCALPTCNAETNLKNCARYAFACISSGCRVEQINRCKTVAYVSSTSNTDDFALNSRTVLKGSSSQPLETSCRFTQDLLLRDRILICRSSIGIDTCTSISVVLNDYVTRPWHPSNIFSMFIILYVPLILCWSIRKPLVVWSVMSKSEAIRG